MATKKKVGPSAFLALFAPKACQTLKHRHCGATLCPCNDARDWLATLPRRATFEDIWNSCERNDWLLWLATKYGLNGANTPDDTRGLIPWTTMEKAIATIPTTSKCGYCGESFLITELHDGYCESCESDHRVFCAACDETHSRDDNHPCAHLRWCDSVGDFVGTGADHCDHSGLHESLEALFKKLGLVLMRELLSELEKGEFGRRSIDDEFGDCGPRLGELWDMSRDVDGAQYEHGLLWLDTLHPHQSEDVSMVTRLAREHIDRREKAIAADKNPRRIVIDGAGRVYVLGGTWSGVKAHAHRMQKRRAHKLRRRIKKAFPGTSVKVVHVLTPAPRMNGAAR